MLRGYCPTYFSSLASLVICTVEIHTFSYDVSILFAQLALLQKLQSVSFEDTSIIGYVVNGAFYGVGIKDCVVECKGIKERLEEMAKALEIDIEL